jgi:hypothetical protein
VGSIPAGRPPAILADPLLAVSIMRVGLDDLPRVRTAFAEGHKHAPGCDRMPWRYYKRFVVPEFDEVLAHPDTVVLGAYVAPELGSSAPELCGWIAFARGRRVDTVHWVSTPYWFPVPHEACIGCEPSESPRSPTRHAAACPLADANRTPLRRRGIMTALLDAAALQERLVYTFRGAKHEHRNDGITMDQRLLPMLRARGHRGVEHVPWKEWSK